MYAPYFYTVNTLTSYFGFCIFLWHAAALQLMPSTPVDAEQMAVGTKKTLFLWGRKHSNDTVFGRKDKDKMMQLEEGRLHNGLVGHILDGKH